MNKVLITGAQGFLGRNAAAKFKNIGYHVTGIGHGHWNTAEYHACGIDRWIEADVTRDALKTLGEFNVIIHCAGSGSVGYSLFDPAEDFRRTVITTLDVLEYMRNCDTRTMLIYPSSAAVYGAKDDIPIREDSPLHPISPYGYNKKIAEELCESYAMNFGLNITIVRFFSLYGNGLKKQLLWDACKKFFAGGASSIIFHGTGEETRDWIHINDAVDLLREVAEMGQGFQIYNGASGKRVTVREILAMLVQEMDSPCTISFNGIIREGDPRYYLADMSRTFTLAWRPDIGIHAGVKNYVSWFKEQGIA